MVLFWSVNSFSSNERRREIVSDGKGSSKKGRNLNQTSITDKESRTMQNALKNTIPTFIINSNHEVIEWNEALEKLTKVQKDEVLGTANSWKAFYDEERVALADIVLDEDDPDRHYII